MFDVEKNTKLAVVFPGQGSQSLGMLSAFSDSPILRDTFEQASEVLGYDLWDLTQNGPEVKLNQTEYTQPALLTAEVALWRMWQSRSEETSSTGQHLVLAGHSLGEFSALVCAGSLDFSSAVLLVRERGRFMQQAVPEGVGAMAAILGLDDEQVREVCAQATRQFLDLHPSSDPHPSSDSRNSIDSQRIAGDMQQISGDSQQTSSPMVSAANYNAPGQVVIAGNAEVVAIAIELAKSKGAKRAIKLQVSVPSHCILMEPAAHRLAEILDQISFDESRAIVLHNVDVSQHKASADIRKALVEQLYKPVRWREIVQKMSEMGIETIIECGPGSVLSSLNKRIAPALNCDQVTNILMQATSTEGQKASC